MDTCIFASIHYSEVSLVFIIHTPVAASRSNFSHIWKKTMAKVSNELCPLLQKCRSVPHFFQTIITIGISLTMNILSVLGLCRVIQTKFKRLSNWWRRSWDTMLIFAVQNFIIFVTDLSTSFSVTLPRKYRLLTVIIAVSTAVICTLDYHLPWKAIELRRNDIHSLTKLTDRIFIVSCSQTFQASSFCHPSRNTLAVRVFQSDHAGLWVTECIRQVSRHPNKRLWNIPELWRHFCYVLFQRSTTRTGTGRRSRNIQLLRRSRMVQHRRPQQQEPRSRHVSKYTPRVYTRGQKLLSKAVYYF